MGIFSLPHQPLPAQSVPIGAPGQLTETRFKAVLEGLECGDQPHLQQENIPDGSIWLKKEEMQKHKYILIHN